MKVCYSTIATKYRYYSEFQVLYLKMLELLSASIVIYFI